MEWRPREWKLPFGLGDLRRPADTGAAASRAWQEQCEKDKAAQGRHEAEC